MAENKEDIFLIEAKKRFEASESAENENRRLALEDISFVWDLGDGQWNPADKTERSNEQRPCLTVNLLQKIVLSLIGDQRQNRPKIKVRPVDDNADVETAKIYDHIISHIHYNSLANLAQDKAYEQALAGGFGFYRLDVEYIPNTFQQEIKVVRIPNQFSVHLDQAANEYDFSDMDFAFVTERIKRDDFKRKYPNNDPVPFDSSGIGEDTVSWAGEDDLLIAEYWYREYKKVTLVELDNGETVRLVGGLTKKAITDAGFKILQERVQDDYVIMWCKLTGNEILEKPREWQGRFIPIIPVLGIEVNIDGKRYLKSVVRDAKDPQRIYNFEVSASIEHIATSTKAPWLATDKQVAGNEHVWEQANKKTLAYLPYKHQQGVPPPQRVAPAAIPTGSTNSAAIAKNDIQEVTGMPNVSVGRESTDRSGVMLQARRQQGSTITYTFIDNLIRATIYEGRVLVDLIPHIYNDYRILRILGEDGNEQEVEINRPTLDIGTGRISIANDITVGKYDIQVDVNASYLTRRMEAVESYLGVMQYAPSIAPYIVDIVAENMDAPGSEKLAERARKLLPPQLQEEGGAGGAAGAPVDFSNIPVDQPVPLAG
jgi:hypothetical protein